MARHRRRKSKSVNRTRKVSRLKSGAKRVCKCKTVKRR